MIPLFIESILFFRLLVVYPPRLISRRLACGIYIPLVLFKVARLVNEIVFIVNFTISTAGATTSPEISRLTAERVEPKIEWVIQVLDNRYVFVSSLYNIA